MVGSLLRHSIPANYEPNSEHLVFCAAAQLLLPSLYPRLSSLNRLHLLPPDLLSALQAVTLLNAERNQFILSELHALTALLNPLGIQPLFLKGAAYLLSGAYPNDDHLGSRYLDDIDLVIPNTQTPIAQAALLSSGYIPQPDGPLDVFRHHHPPIASPSGVRFELHHSLALGRTASRLLTVSEMLSDSTLLNWQSVQLRIPSPNHLITHLILHSQIRHPYRERIYPPLRAMYDLLLLADRFAPTLDWPAIQARWEAAGQLTTFKLHLLQVESTLGMTRPLPITLTPFEKLRWLRRRLLNRWPTLRFFDPSYLLLATLSRRWHLLQSILSTPGGYKSALRMLLSPSFYRRLLGDLF